MKKLQITIPKPCHENWQVMTSVEKGKFCSACQKNVIDFTKATDREIIQAYNDDKKLCGRFLNTQLNRELTVPKEKKSIWLASVFFGMISLANSKIIAQEKPNTEQTEVIRLLGKPAQIQEEVVNEEKTITGIVSDSSGPLPGVNVIVKGTQRGISTDFDGKYSIQAKEGEILVFSFMGMEEENLIIDKKNFYKTKMTNNIKGNMIFMVGGISAKRKTFFGRQFYKIGNWFKKEE